MSSSLAFTNRAQRGVALLIAIFALVLISGIAIALIVVTGTEAAINANYRRSIRAFYSAQAGLEEARERIVANAPDTVRNNPSFPNPLLPVLGQVLYIVNPGPNDPLFNPQVGPPAYYDSEYQQEFGTPPVANLAQLVPSSPLTTVAGLPPLDYKWVRITLKTEEMGTVDLNGDGWLDPFTPVRVAISDSQCLPTMPGCSDDPNQPVTTNPVYRVTAYALDRTTAARRILQAEVAELPTVNPNGAIASKAGVSINGNFNAFGAWPPIVRARCGKTDILTCGYYDKGAVVGDCTKPYDPTTDTCAGLPRSHNDYCNLGDSVNGVSSGGNISAGGSYDEVPEEDSYCATTGPGCVFTVSPDRAFSPNMSNWPYDMDQIVEMFKPPVTQPLTDFRGVTCTAFDANGNRTCGAQGVRLGTLPSPWPPPPNTPLLNNQAEYVYADVGTGGLAKLTGASSGSGLLVVNGDLSIEAGFQWYGLVIVRGIVTFLGGGSTPTNIFGGVIAGQSVTNASTTTGGSVSVIYSSCAYRFNYQNAPPRYLSFREIPQP